MVTRKQSRVYQQNSPSHTPYRNSPVQTPTKDTPSEQDAAQDVAKDEPETASPAQTPSKDTPSEQDAAQDVTKDEPETTTPEASAQTSVTGPRRYLAVCDYDPEDDDEMDFEEGDVSHTKRTNKP